VGGPFVRTKGAKRVVAVDVTRLPVGGLVVPACAHENTTTELMLEHLAREGVTERLKPVMVDRGVTASGATRLGRPCSRAVDGGAMTEANGSWVAATWEVQRWVSRSSTCRLKGLITSARGLTGAWSWWTSPAGDPTLHT
jgi:hypothetical protein